MKFTWKLRKMFFINFEYKQHSFIWNRWKVASDLSLVLFSIIFISKSYKHFLENGKIRRTSVNGLFLKGKINQKPVNMIIFCSFIFNFSGVIINMLQQIMQI